MSRAFLAAVFLLIALIPAGATTNELALEAKSEPNSDGTIDITIHFLDEKRQTNEVTIDPSSPGVSNGDCYQLLVTTNGKVTRIPVKVLKSAAPKLTQISLRPATPLKKGTKYKLIIQKDCLRVTPPPGKVIASFENKELQIDQKRLENDIDFVNPLPETKLSLLQSKDSGVFSSSAYYRQFFGATRSAAFHANVDADVSFRSPQNANYINKIEGELGGYWVDVGFLGGLAELGGSSKLQADQQFKKVDQTVGLNGWFYIPNEVTATIYRFPTSVFQPQKEPLVALPPTIILGYDYVGHLKNNTTSPDTGHNRATGRFYWAIPVLDESDFSGIPLIEQIKSLTFISDLSTIYEFDKRKWTGEAKLSLDFGLTKSDKAPSISLSYAKGKAAPTFKNFDAFLAGFKMPF